MMSSRLPLEPEDLDHFLVKTRDSIPFANIHANPFFYISKPTEANLSKYKFLKPDSAVGFIFDLMVFVPTILLQLFLSIIISLFFSKEYKNRPMKDLSHCKYLFISHFTHAQDVHKDDIFYGKVSRNSNCFVFYLNHTRVRSAKIVKRFKNAGKENIQVNSKSLKLIPLILLQVHQIRISSWIFIRAISDRTLTISRRRVLIRAAISQHARSTIANLVLKNRLKNQLLITKPEFVVITVEGHAYEAMIIKLIKEFFQEIRIIGYQHAPIVPSQYNVFRNVSGLRPKDFFFTSGESIKELGLSKFHKCKVATLGSPKSRDFVFEEKNSSKLNLLFAPEGTRNSILQFIDLLNDLSPLLQDNLLILRLHPALSCFDKKMVNRKLLRIQNIQLSRLTLEEDLRRAHLLFFESSAIAIEGLAFGVVPVHIEFRNDQSLNPLMFTKLDRISLQLKDVADFIRNFNMKINQDEDFQRDCYAHFSEYYANLQDIDSIISQANF